MAKEDDMNTALAAIDAYCTDGIVPKDGRFIFPGTPEYLKRIGSDETEITLPVSVVKKAMETHHLTKDEIKFAVCQMYDPVLVFDSDKSTTENKADSRLILTNEFKDGKPIALSVNVNADVQFQKDGHRTSLEVQDIRSIHDRTLIAKNGTDLIKKWTENGLCRYVDDKKITDWSTIARVYFPIEVLQSADNTILRKSDIVNQEIGRFTRNDLHFSNRDETLNSADKVEHISKENKEMEAKPNEEANSILTPKEYLKSLLSKAEIEVVEDTGVMRAILDEGKRVQKMAAKYGTSQDIDGEETFNGFGTYVVSVNEENARQLGIKIASKKYGGNFYINEQPFNEFLREKNFSPYWTSRLEQFNDHSVEFLADDFLRADVKGNPALEKERDTLSTLFSLDLVEYKREQTFLYSVDIPDNNGTNYLLYGNPIGIENANRINERLERMNVEWRVTRNDIGKNVYFNTLSEKVFGGSQESASKFLKETGYAGMEMNSANYIVFDDKDMKVTNRVQYMIDGESNVYGFAYDGKIYADPEIATSNTYAHEYTHLWDAYTQRTNPELWEKGKDIFKGTSLWNEVMTDENYQNLSNDDEILSECHSRIVGRMAEKVLERIAERNGGILRDQVIDWDSEVAEYVAGELGVEFPQPELESKNYISDSVRLEIAREFLSQPMKDLMEGRKIGVEREKSELYKENEAELKFIVEEMMEETLPGLQKMAKSVENEKDSAASTSTQLSGATSAQDPLDAQDTATAISTHIRHKNNIVEIKNQGHFIEKFNAFASEITNSDTPLPPNEFLDKIKKTFDMNVAAETTGYVFTKENDETFKIRISDHKAVLRNRLGARTELTSLVIQLNDSRRRDSDKAKLSEFVYFPESLDKETQLGIINGINDWISGHEYTDKHYDQMFVSTARALQERLKESEQTVEKMAEEHAFPDVSEYFKFNKIDNENFGKALDNFDGVNPLQLIKVGEIPPVMKALGISDNPIEMPQSVVSKALREEATYPNDKKGHALTMEHVKRIPESLADPIMVFKSRTRDDSYVFFTEQKDESNRSIIIPVAVDKRYGRLVINEITSIYGRTNEVDFVKTNIEQGNLVYADKKRSLDWERECQIQFLAQVLPSEGSYSSILTKENLVNFVSAVGNEKIQKMAKFVENEKNPAASTSTQLSGVTSAQSPLDAQDTATAISTHIHDKDNIVEIKNQEWRQQEMEENIVPAKENRTMENEMADELDTEERQKMDSYYKRFVKEASDKTDEGQLQKAFALSLEKNIVPLTEVKLNRENWNMLFPNGLVETPVGTVKLGENQFEKLQKSDRHDLLGAMYETLSNPAIVLEKETFDKNSGDFKPVNVYGKSFVREDSNHKRAVESVVIFKDGEEISISTHNKDINGFVKQIKTADQIIYADSEISRVASLILQNGGSHVRLQDAISNRAINLKYNKNNVLSINDIEFSQEEVVDKENAAKNRNGDAGEFSLNEQQKPAEENVAEARKTVKASEIFKDFEESMIFSGISQKDFDSAMLDYLHQRSGREEAETEPFDTQVMFEFLVAQKIHDERARDFALNKIGQYEGMTVEFDADNIDLGYLRLSDREGAKEVEKELEELKAAHSILVKNLSRQNETEETAKVENPFLSANPEQIQELYEQAEAVEEMQEEAASNVEFDENGNPYYPKNESAEENSHSVIEEDSREYWKDKFVNDNSETFKMVDDFLNEGIKPKNDEFIFPNVPEILKFADVSENEIVIKTSVINKAMNEHSLSTKEIREAIENIASPVLIFESDKNSTENKKDSYLSLTDTFAENGKPIAFAMNLDSEYERKNRIIEVNEIRTIHDRTLVAKNGTDLIQKWTAEGLCRYVDDKKISDWGKAAGVQFPLAVLQSDNNSISTKSEFDKQFDDKKTSDWQLAAGVQSPLAVLQSDDNNILRKSDIVNNQDDFQEYSDVMDKGIEKTDNLQKKSNEVEQQNEKIATVEYIHSSEFIEKFGDWEKANRLEKLKESQSLGIDNKIYIHGIDETERINELRNNPNDENLRELSNLVTDMGKEMLKNLRAEQNLNNFAEPILMIKDDEKKYKFNFSGIKETGHHNLYQKGHIEGIFNIPSIVNNAIYIGEEKNEDNRKPELEKFYYYALGIKLENEDYTAKVVFTENKNGEVYYDQSLSTIEKGKFVDIIKNEPVAVNPINRRDSNEHSDEYPSTYYDKRLYQICQVPQMPYLEKNKDGQWQPTEEAIEAVRNGNLKVKKEGQSYEMIDSSDEKPVRPVTEQQTINPDDKKQDTAQTVDKDILPAFALVTKDGLKMFEGYKVQGFDNETRKYTVGNERGDSIKIDETTLESIRNPKNTITAEKEKNSEAVQTQSAIVAGKTRVPEFAMITQNGLKEFKDMVVQKYSPSEKMWTLSNAEGESVSISENTFKELTSENQRSRAREFDENTPAYKKMLETQYNDYFKQRENTASNFIHNLSVYSRKEANSPIDAIRLSSVIIKQMSPGEKQKTKELLKTLCKDGETINGLIANTYLEAVKDKPLNEEYILSGRYKDTIARPMYDTISAKGEKVDNKFDLRIGDTISNVSFKTKKTFGAGSEKMVADWTVLSASKEGNIITLKSGNSFRDVPRDTFLKQYSKQEKNEQKQQVKERKRNTLNMDIER